MLNYSIEKEISQKISLCCDIYLSECIPKEERENHLHLWENGKEVWFDTTIMMETFHEAYDGN